MSYDNFREIAYSVDRIAHLLQAEKVRWTDVDTEALRLLERTVAFLQKIPVQKS